MRLEEGRAGRGAGGEFVWLRAKKKWVSRLAGYVVGNDGHQITLGKNQNQKSYAIGPHFAPDFRGGDSEAALDMSLSFLGPLPPDFVGPCVFEGEDATDGLVHVLVGQE